MKSSWQRGNSFFKILIILAVIAVIVSVGIPSIKTLTGQTGIRVCEKNIETITRIENEYYNQFGQHTQEYLNLDFVDEDSDLYIAGFLSDDDIVCKQTGGKYQWQNIDGEIVLVCTVHQ